jgi:adenosine deaminase
MPEARSDIVRRFRAMAEHPFRTYLDQGFRVTLNTDNRLMSRTSMTEEYVLAVEEFDCDPADLERLSINGIKSAFLHYDQRVAILYDRVKAGFAALREEGAL